MTEEQLRTIWKNAMKEVEFHYSPMVFKTWFNQTSLQSLKNGLVELRVENIATKNFVHKVAEGRLLAALAQEAGFPIKKAEYIVQETAKPEKKATLFEDTKVPVMQLNAETPALETNLNPKYTFTSFIVGNRNRLAYAAAQAVAEAPGKAYNPLYLYGGVGLGKTHLMQAVGHEIIARNPQKRVVYVSCENFTNDFTNAIRGNKIDAFKKKYRNVDVFLVDDIQFLASKDGTQEEFFHTFNALYQTDKQIVITSDKAPTDIKDLEERLSSRFSSGMIADMQLPDVETRQAILQAKCEERKIKLPDQILLCIADLVETNIRELEGALNTFMAHLKESGSEPTMDMVKTALHSFANRKPLKRGSLEEISQIVCEFYGVDLKEIKGQRRQAEIVKPRQVLMYLMKYELNMTFPTIGREIGGRDHTTAMHSVDKVEKDMKKSPELFEELKRIKELFYVANK